MRRIVFQILLSVVYFSANGQVVSNVRAEQRGQSIVVFYSLETTSPCEVSLLLSQDNGATWGSPLKNVSGDVGKNISAGDKKITWKVLEEQESFVGENIKFKVEAEVRKSFEPEMVFVEGGTFQMGNSSGNSFEKPVHSVTLSSFNMGKYEVTQAQWQAVMGSNPSNFWRCDNCPLEKASWLEVQQYIQKLNAQTGKNYRLPTEAEWEYAAKGGKESKGYTYSGSNDINAVAWYRDNSGSETHVVGTKQANELGIFDMSGNVWEWCSDWSGNYSSNSVTNPKGTLRGAYRVLRGGGWNCYAFDCRPSYRIGFIPDDKHYDYGFRLVLPVEN
jgi:formylglycine-generating enzyme required for sulfatase activity